MKNEYEIRGEVTAIVINSKKFGLQETLISTSNLERAKEFKGSWCVGAGKKDLYIVGSLKTKDGKKMIRFHRWMTNAPDGMAVDHINHDTLDNTDGNLRIITGAQNLQNRNGAMRNSKSGIRGVSWNKCHKKWEARLRTNNKVVHLGYFNEIDIANKSVIEARKIHMPFSIEA